MSPTPGFFLCLPPPQSIDIHLKKDTRRGVVNNQQTDWSFKLDGVLHDATQDLVYETVAKDAVSQALDGYNGNLINCCFI